MIFELRRIPMCNLGKDTKKLSVNKLKLMFDRFDKDEIGVLDLEEFTEAGKKLKFGTFQNILIKLMLIRVVLTNSKSNFDSEKKIKSNRKHKSNFHL